MKRVDGLLGRSLGREDTAILIPVRLGGSRFPDKAIKLLWGKPLFWWAYRAARLSNVAALVRVVTDSLRVATICNDIEWNDSQRAQDCTLRSELSHPTGSDRLAAALSEHSELDSAKVIINLQCDEPQITTTDLTVLAREVWANRWSVQVATLATPLILGDRSTPNVVKVMVDRRNLALYFTRSVMPGQRDSCMTHVGVYAFRRPALESFGRYPRGNLERAENLEQLRLLEEGVPINVVRINGSRRAVNTKEDLEWLEQQESPATT